MARIIFFETLLSLARYSGSGINFRKLYSLVSKFFKLLESENIIKKSFFVQKIQLGKVTCFSKFAMTPYGNHDNH